MNKIDVVAKKLVANNQNTVIRTFPFFSFSFFVYLPHFFPCLVEMIEVLQIFSNLSKISVKYECLKKQSSKPRIYGTWVGKKLQVIGKGSQNNKFGSQAILIIFIGIG